MDAPKPVVFPPGAAVVRYQTLHVDRAVAFYTQHLGFTLRLRAGPGFALVFRGSLNLILSGPSTSGARPMPDGAPQRPGGWNRIVLYVDSLSAAIDTLRNAGAHFRNDVEVGPGGKQILLDDPDGNPVELHEAPDPLSKASPAGFPLLAVSVVGLTPGRLGGLAALLLGLFGVIVGARAVMRRAPQPAVFVLGAAGLVAGVGVVLSARGGLGTGHGFSGGVVAILLGVVATALGVLARARAGRG